MVAFYSNFLSRVTGKAARPKPAGSARALVAFSDAYIVDHFARFGYAVALEQLVFTTETVADFVNARDDVWHRPGTIVRLEIAGLLIVEDAQPHPLQPTRDILVVSLGRARVVMGVINRHGRSRFAETM